MKEFFCWLKIWLLLGSNISEKNFWIQTYSTIFMTSRFEVHFVYLWNFLAEQREPGTKFGLWHQTSQSLDVSSDWLILMIVRDLELEVEKMGNPCVVGVCKNRAQPSQVIFMHCFVHKFKVFFLHTQIIPSTINKERVVLSVLVKGSSAGRQGPSDQSQWSVKSKCQLYSVLGQLTHLRNLHIQQIGDLHIGWTSTISQGIRTIQQVSPATVKGTVAHSLPLIIYF